MRLFFAGIREGNPGGVQSWVNAGDGWKEDPGHASMGANAGGPIGAANSRLAGVPMFAWASGTSLFVHGGLVSGGADRDIGPTPLCCYAWPDLATDMTTGRTWLAYASIVNSPDRAGLWVQQVENGLGQSAPQTVGAAKLGSGTFCRSRLTAS